MREGCGTRRAPGSLPGLAGLGWGRVGRLSFKGPGPWLPGLPVSGPCEVVVDQKHYTGVTGLLIPSRLVLCAVE